MRKTLFRLLAAVVMMAAFSGPASAFTLPIEVMMGNAPRQTVYIALPVGAAAQAVALQLRLQGVEYDSEAGVKINSAPQIALTKANTRPIDTGAEWGGIGGPLNVFSVQIALPAGALVDGKNALTFSYLNTDGVNSGYRVLGVAMLDANGKNLISPNPMSWDNPAKWTAPLVNGKPSLPADVQAGWLTYTTASLIISPMNSQRLGVHCADCHTADGRDLAIFNYSNLSIVSRSMFHGLTRTQGQQIAAYIRSLPYKTVGGRPWNPPYQPGPGLDSLPANEWAAGAGLEAVAPDDASAFHALFPNGVSRQVVSTQGYLNVRETPQHWVLPTWNQWLPTVHPLDAPWGARFATDPFYQDYYTFIQNAQTAQAKGLWSTFLGGNNGWDMRPTFFHWVFVDGLNFDKFIRTNYTYPTTCTPAIAEAAASTWKWRLVKEFELMQTYGLETQGAAVYGPGRLIEPRTWYTQSPFNTSPHAIGIQLDHNDRTLHGSTGWTSYFVEAWYHLQMILQPGNGAITGESPFDYPYSYGTFNHTSDIVGPHAAWLMEVMVKGGQETDNDLPLTDKHSWNPHNVFDPGQLLPHSGVGAHLWDGYDAPTRLSIYSAFLGAWADTTTRFAAADYQAAGLGSATEPINLKQTGSESANFGGKVYNWLKVYTALGADPGQVGAIDAWAKGNWPASASTFQYLMIPFGGGSSPENNTTN